MDTPRLVHWTRNLEDTAALDGAVRALEPLVDAAFATGRRGEVLRGDWLGHAVHPVLTDVVLGTWASATILDLVGGRESRSAAQRLLGVSLLVGNRCRSCALPASDDAPPSSGAVHESGPA